MIVPMKKYSFLVYHKEYLNFLNKLRELGIVHVIEKESGEIEDEELRTKHAQLKELNEAIKFLEKRDVEVERHKEDVDGLKILDEIKSLRLEQENSIQRLASIQKEMSLLEPWGDFSWESINRLKESDFKITFFVGTKRSFNPEWENTYNISIINELSGFIYFVVISKTQEIIELDAEEVKLPQKSLSQLKAIKKEIEEIMSKTEDIFDSFAAKYSSVLKDTQKEISSQLNFKKVVLNTQKEAEDRLMILEGWAPEDKEEALISFLNNSNVYYESSRPEAVDSPPVKLKNNKFARLFETIGELYSFPDYKELDLTPFFAPFFMLFFGFCLGDAGYGILFILGATYFKFKVDKKLKPLLSLVQFLGLATVLFGAITGTVFGMNLIDSGYTITEHSIALLQQQNIPADIISKLQSVIDVKINSKTAFIGELNKIFNQELPAVYEKAILKYAESDFPILNSFRYLLLDPNQMFKLALILGGIQIIFGMFIKAANQAKMFGYRYAFATVGWLTLILGGGIIYGLNVASIIDNKAAKLIFFVVLGISSLGIYFFNDPKRNILVNFGAGLWDTYNMITGILGDLLSYIRLFALGISSAILGFVFNDLAMNMSPETPVAGQLVFVIILLIGHGINIFMSGLGSFVHPLRLTFVEFYKNAGYIGGGKKYTPFSK